MEHYWDYRLVKLVNRDDEINDEPLYIIAEVFFEDDKPYSYAESDTIQGSVEDMKWMINKFNECLDKGLLVFDEKNNKFIKE